MNNYNRYKSSAELKAIAKERLFGKYGTVIGASVLVLAITSFITLFSTIFIDTNKISGVIANFIISFIISLFAALLTSGEKYLYLKVACGQPVTISDVFYGFKFYPNKAVMIQLFISALLYLFMLPMTILAYMVMRNPDNSLLMLGYSLSMILYGVAAMIVELVYFLTFYLLHDFPGYSVTELLSMSRRLMKGSKGRLFYLMVSFFPLFLLGALSCGAAYLWIIPYMNTTMAEFFLDLIQNHNK